MKKSTTLLCLLFFIVSCQSSSSYSSAKEKTAEELKQELRQKETEQASSYLVANAKMRENLIDEKVIEGTISSSSSVTMFKDIVLEITFMSKTETALSVQKHILYDLISPNTKIPFKIKTFAPEATEKFSIRVVGATPN